MNIQQLIFAIMFAGIFAIVGTIAFSRVASEARRATRSL